MTTMTQTTLSPIEWAALDDVTDFDEAIEAFDPVMGLEVHVELGTATKMFCACATTFGAEPNTQVCPVCLALPGAMPAVNGTAVEYAIRIGLALNCSIAPWCRFARKNYFYPDMPKNFQTSQYDEPIAFNGYLDVPVGGEIVRVEIERAHMEEDTGKSTHIGGATGRIQGAEFSLLDYNRAGVPLVEIVTKPIVGTKASAPEVAKAYVATLQDLVRSLGVSDVRMDQGSMRCDVNLSLTPAGHSEFGTRTETKNVNSLRSVERAARFEICRQASVLQAGGVIRQETRHFDELTGTTSSGRAKETAEDYRYFPEPDLVPVAPSAEWVAEIGASLPELPWVRRDRLQGEWGFTDLEMRDLVNARGVDLVAATVEAGSSAGDARSWWMSYLAQQANTAGVELSELAITPTQLAAVIAMVSDGSLTTKLARQVVDGVLAGEGEPAAVVAARGLAVVSDDTALQAAIDEALTAQPDVADKIRSGKMQAIGAIVGAVMKATRGQADAAKVRELTLTTLGVSA
jgi:aspartyl-tRNA(Asn)/glutamyl-tRNA(Gln) amidotransferase subunit B